MNAIVKPHRFMDSIQRVPASTHRRLHARHPRATVALGGGGARGLAHLGAMEAIGESGVSTERIVGTSIGSLMGALCAVDQDIYRVQASAIQLLHSPIFSEKCRRLMGSASRVTGGPPPVTKGSIDWWSQWYGRIENVMRHGHRVKRMMSGSSILSNEILTEAIEHSLPDVELDALPIPLSVVAVDLVSGRTVVLEKGPLRLAVTASMSIPGFFPPVPWEDMLLCDIGVLDSLPAGIARSYDSDVTIAVDVSGTIRRQENFSTALDVVLRMEEIGENLCRRGNAISDMIRLRPAVGDRLWYDFTDPEELIEAGRVAGRTVLEKQLRQRVEAL